MKFVLTKELGRLAKWLRILGFDTAYFTQDKEASLIIKALQEERIILTRNLHLGQHPGDKKVADRLGYLSKTVSSGAQRLVAQTRYSPDVYPLYNLQ